MFERFTRDARTTVTAAVAEAQEQHAADVTPEHLALALLGSESTGAIARLLADHDVTRDALTLAFDDARRRGGLSESEADALQGLGIDVADVVESVEHSLGTGALAQRRPRARRWFGPRLPFHTDTKALLEQTLHEALELGDRRISTEHMLLAFLRRDGLVRDVLTRHGLTHTDVITWSRRREAS